MYSIRRGADRGTADFGWLKAKHTFSFGQYRDPNYMGFSILRVINDDIIAGNSGFSTHSHDNMEILTFIHKGEISHEDSEGNKASIVPGEIQIMSAGSGISHSEMNNKDDEINLFQIWIEPNIRDTKPGYQQKSYSAFKCTGGVRLLASENGEDGSLLIKADAKVYLADLKNKEKLNFEFSENRAYWVQMIEGKLNFEFTAKSVSIEQRDAIALLKQSEIKAVCEPDAKFLIFDLPAKI